MQRTVKQMNFNKNFLKRMFDSFLCQNLWNALSKYRIIIISSNSLLWYLENQRFKRSSVCPQWKYHDSYDHDERLHFCRIHDWCLLKWIMIVVSVEVVCYEKFYVLINKVSNLKDDFTVLQQHFCYLLLWVWINCIFWYPHVRSCK